MSVTARKRRAAPAQRPVLRAEGEGRLACAELRRRARARRAQLRQAGQLPAGAHQAAAGRDDRPAKRPFVVVDPRAGQTIEDILHAEVAFLEGVIALREGALAAIPKMLPADAAARARLLETVRRAAQAAGKPRGEKALRLAQVEKLFAGGTRAAALLKRARTAA